MSPRLSRRDFVKGVGATAVALSLTRLRLPSALASPPSLLREPQPYGGWEDLYREKWRWDAVVKGTHHRANCLSACSWDLYVKDGLVWREEQAAVHGESDPALPDFNPRGCQKGACYSALMVDAARPVHPLKCVGERGSGRWKRIGWKQALDEIADAIVDTCVQDGPECVVYEGGTTNVDFGPDTAAEMRFFNLLGATTLDSNGGGVGDLPMGAVQTWGIAYVDGTSDDWMHAEQILVWSMNPAYTRIPDTHFLWEARYRGARVAVLSPDYSATALHADLWLNPKVGTDAALALAMARVILDEGLLDLDYVREQTDLPFLVRTDTGRFLRDGDLRKGGREDLFYFWDGRDGGPVRAPATKGDWWFRKLDLGEREPALEGAFRVTLHDGREVSVRPVLELLRERLAPYTPEHAAAISGVSADAIRALARDFGRARRGLILASYGACKHFHGDLLQRALILLVALTGNQGKRGGGLRVAAWWSLSGFENIAGGYEPPFLAEQLLRLYRPPARTMEFFLSEHMRENYLMTPTLLWLYVHGGLAKLHAEIEPELRESLRQGWMPVYPQPGKDPRVLICTGGNPLRRWPAPHLIEEQLWPKLDLVVSIDFRMSTTGLKSDLVLPAAGYYEKPGVKYAQSYLPYVVVGEKAIEPLGEAKSEWEIFGLLARRVEQRAVERNVRPVQDPLGLEHDLRALYRSWSADGEFPVENEERALDYIVGRSEPIRGLTWREAARRGAIRIREPGRYTPANGVASDIAPGETVAPSRWFVEQKEPWPTLTGRQQFLIDHPRFIAAGEDLPTFKELPAIGGPYPLRLTGGHTRWSIHALWRNEERLLRLQRGEPVAYMNVADATARKIRDHDRVRVYNDVGSFRIVVKRSPAVQPGQVVVYHAWEPYQFADWQSDQNAVSSPIKPLHLVGDYAQIHYRTGLAAPCYVPRGTSVEVEKV